LVAFVLGIVKQKQYYNCLFW